MSKFRIHNFLSFSLKNSYKSPFARFLWPRVAGEYESFQCNLPGSHDIELDVGPFSPQNDGSYILDGRCFVRGDYLCANASYKMARFSYEISGWESDHLRARISCNNPGFLVLSGLIIDPIILYALIQRKIYPIHAACIADDEGAYILAGSSGTGKTTISLGLLEDGYSILGDNYSLLSRGSVYSFLSPLNIFSYNLVPALKQRISGRDLDVLKLKHLLWRVTRGYIKIFTKINITDLWPARARCQSASPKAMLFIIKSQNHRIERMSAENMAAALVANMRLEIPMLLEWLGQYSFINPTFAPHKWLERYEKGLLEQVSSIPRLLRVEIPHTFERVNNIEIRALLSGNEGTE